MGPDRNLLCLLCYAVDGEELWRHPLGPFDNLYGMGASPILAAGNVVLVVDQQQGSHVLAVDSESGELAWRTERPAARSGHSTPALHRPEGGELQIVVPGSFFLTSYSAGTGERLWWVSGLSFEMKSTPAIGDGVLFINGYAMPLNEEGRHVRLEPFREVVATHDGDGDGKISEEISRPATYGGPIIARSRSFRRRSSTTECLRQARGTAERWLSRAAGRFGSRRPGHGNAGDRPDDDVSPHTERPVGFSAFG